MSPEVQKIVVIVAGILATPLALLAAAALNKLTQKLSGEAVQAKANGKQSMWFNLSSRVTHITEVVVRDLQETMAKALREATADGSISEEEGKKLKELALLRVRLILGTEGLNDLNAFLGEAGLDTYLGGLIESVLGVMKTNDAAINRSLAGVAMSPLPFAPSTPGGLPMPPSDS